MTALTSWMAEARAANNTSFFGIEDAVSAHVVLDSNNLCKSGLPSIVEESPALAAYSAWCRSWPRPTPRS
jgi:hypothetical protein